MNVDLTPSTKLLALCRDSLARNLNLSATMLVLNATMALAVGHFQKESVYLLAAPDQPPTGSK